MVSSRITDPVSFDGVVAKDGVLALSRSAQQSALGRANVQLTLTPSGSNIVVTSIVSGAVSTTRSFPANEVAITAGSVGSGTTCGSISSTITLNFDSAGEIEAVDDDGFPICLNGREQSLYLSRWICPSRRVSLNGDISLKKTASNIFFRLSIGMACLR